VKLYTSPAHPNIERWPGKMRGHKNWAKVHEAIDRFAASTKSQSFITI
jgi:hypothetical protein